MATWYHDLSINDCWHWNSSHLEITVALDTLKDHGTYKEFRIYIKFIDFHAQTSTMCIVETIEGAKTIAMQMAHDKLMEFRNDALESDIELYDQLKERLACLK
ncbi:MAG: hypothetical protein HDQ88_08705 [Clostridia bacterium]|nr:hypothetical protein [Clostridia bacterium]